MKKHFPHMSLIAVFAVLSLILAAVASSGMLGGHGTDVMLALISMPLFVTCAIMGMHKSGRLAPVRQEIPVRKRK